MLKQVADDLVALLLLWLESYRKRPKRAKKAKLRKYKPAPLLKKLLKTELDRAIDLSIFSLKLRGTLT